VDSIHFIGGEKGGVGKSMTSRLLSQYFIDRGIPFYAFDSDSSHATLSRFYGEYAEPVDVESYESLDNIVALAERQPGTSIVVDLAAQTVKHLNAWLEESDIFQLLEELGKKVYFWHLVDDGVDSMNLLSRFLLPSYASVQTIVVKNHGRGDNFSMLEQSPPYRQIHDKGAIMLRLAKLQPVVMQKIDFNHLSFWAAANNSNILSTTERRRVTVWLQYHYTQFDRFITLQPADSMVQDTGSQI
jgi:hypothetical protein